VSIVSRHPGEGRDPRLSACASGWTWIPACAGMTKILVIALLAIGLSACGTKGKLKSPSQIEAAEAKKKARAEKAADAQDDQEEDDAPSPSGRGQGEGPHPNLLPEGEGEE